jgi:hypothetical protein
MPTEEHNPARPHQGVSQSVLALMPPLKILATTLGAALLACGLLFAYVSSPAHADTTFVVNSTGDENDLDFPGGTFDGTSDAKCDVDSTLAGDQCTLRAAIQEANVTAGDDTIDIGVTGTVNLTGALPNLSTNIEIEGPGADQFTVRRDTGGDYSIFTVTSGSVVSISGITISNGNTTLPGGGEGGGISNFRGTLTITGSTISGNSATTEGGGIANIQGTLTVTGSTISDNSAFEGGGIYSDTNLSGQTTTITNSTISGNTARLAGDGGGVRNFEGLTVIEFSTITNNTAPNSEGSGVASFADTLTRTEVLSTIISANTNTDVDSGTTTNSFVSKGHNLIGDGNATGAFNQTGDQTGVSDPGLDPLDSYGGPTQSHRLQSDSLAIDAGPPSTSCPPPATDQRGVERPQDGDDDGTANCDIGSFELEALVDTQAPKVIGTFPRNGGEVGPAANIRATFSEDMRPASVMNAFKLFRKGSTNQIAATVTYDAMTDIATLNPDNNLKRGVTYKAVVTTVAKDMAGNRLDQDQDPSNGLQQKKWFFEVD